MPEIGTFSNNAIAKLVGLAPIANDSGKRRATARSAAAVPASARSSSSSPRIAARYDPASAAFHDRLQTAGKAKMVIRIALARKLLVILNAKARDARANFANAT